MAVLDDIREQIKVILQGVPGIGVVHDYYRWATDERKLLSLLQDADGRINAVMFRREKMAKSSLSWGGMELRAHVFAFRCLMGLKDDQATGLLFDALLTGIEEAFYGHEDLNGTCMSIDQDFGPMAGQCGIQVDLVEDRSIGGVLCHYAELRLQVVERH